jgi:hypothetical protein
MKFEVMKKDKLGITIAIMDLVNIHTHREPVFDPNNGNTYNKNYVVFVFKNPLDEKFVNFQVQTKKECDEGLILDLWDNMKNFVRVSDDQVTVKIDQEWLEDEVRMYDKDE